jgi:hypothetical protein
MIWVQARPDPQLVKVIAVWGMYSDKFDIVSKIPALLHTSREARVETLLAYKTPFAGLRTLSTRAAPAGQNPASAYMDLARDTLVLENGIWSLFSLMGIDALPDKEPCPCSDVFQAENHGLTQLFSSLRHIVVCGEVLPTDLLMCVGVQKYTEFRSLQSMKVSFLYDICMKQKGTYEAFLVSHWKAEISAGNTLSIPEFEFMRKKDVGELMEKFEMNRYI